MAPRFRPVPSTSYISSPFGPRWGTEHRGTDFGREGGSAGMAVYASQGGTVVYAGAASGFGGPDPAGWLVVDHPTADGSGTTVYGHIIREVSVGDRVEAGQRIGRVNPDSRTNGGVDPHLHFEVHPTSWLQGTQVDPVAWLGDAPSPDSSVDLEAPEGVLFGVDVSEFQDGMSLKRAAGEGVTFAIIRTTDGTYKDRTYRSHHLDAVEAGLEIAAYHYLRNPSEGTSIRSQVQASLEVMGEDRAPIWLDVETPAGVHVDHIREAKREFEAQGIRVIGAYSYVPYWENEIAPGEPDSHEFGAFWVAAYGPNKSGRPAALYPGNGARQWAYPLGNQRPVLWQFGSRAAVADFLVDINAFRGSLDQLRSLFHGHPVTHPGPSTAPEPVTPAPAHVDTVAPLPYPEGKIPDPMPVPEFPVVRPEDVEPMPEPMPEPVPDPVQDPVPEPTPEPVLEHKPRRTVWDLILDILVSTIVGRRPRDY